MVAEEQAREPGSDGRGLEAGSAEASVRSRLPPCREPRLGAGSPGPGAEETVSMGLRLPMPRWGGHTQAQKQSRRAQRAQGQKPGSHLMGCGLNGGPGRSLSWRPPHGSRFEP